MSLSADHVDCTVAEGMRSNPEPLSRWILPPSWSAATKGRTPLIVAVLVTVAIAVRVWERLPPLPINRRPPGVWALTIERSAEVMPIELIPVMISWAACSRTVSAWSF